MSLVDERTAVAEQTEAAVHRRVVGQAPAEVRARLRISALDLDGAVALALANDPSGYWSKALGLGITAPVTRDLVAELCAFYATNGGSHATIQIAPEALPADWEEIRADHGLAEGHPWIKLLRPATPPPAPPATSLRVGLVPSTELGEWAYVLLEGMGMPHELDSLFTATGDEAFRHVAAWDGDRMVAAATLFVDGDSAHMFGASTLPSHRNRGAQAALVALRLQEAIAAGVQWIVAETWQESQESPNPSLHNLVRAGFAELYVRPNWIWRR